MTTATATRTNTMSTTAALQQCQPWCEYQDCWQDPRHNPAEGIACISTTTDIALEGSQPLASGPGDWPSLSLYLGPTMDTGHYGSAVLLAHGDNRGVYLTPAKARELANALTKLAALADGNQTDA